MSGFTNIQLALGVGLPPPTPTYLLFASNNLSGKSTDGATIVPGGATATLANLKGIAFSPTLGSGSGRWLCSGSGSAAQATIYSDDAGATWTTVNPGLFQNMEQVEWAFNKFWMGSNNGGCFYSATGLAGSWTDAMPGNRGYGLWYSDDEARLVCVGDSNAGTDIPKVFYTDGALVLSVGIVTGLPTGGADPGNTLYGIAKDEERGLWYVINGNGKVYSIPTVSAGAWTHVGDLGVTLTGPARFAFKSGGVGQPIVVIGGNIGGVYTSTDEGANWVQHIPAVIPTRVLWSDYFGAFYFSGSNNYKSVDGTTWVLMSATPYTMVGETFL